MLGVWIKRIVVVVIIAGIVFGYLRYEKWHRIRMEQKADNYALITAQVWVASVRYRNDSQRFIEFRDSVLTAHGFSTDEMFRYLEIYDKRPERYEHFSERVSWLVDSLVQQHQRQLP